MNASETPPGPVGAPDEPVIHSSARGGLRDSVLGTRNLMTVAALGVVGSILVVPLSYLSVVVAVSPRGILIMCALMGAWIIPYLLPGVIVNKPGAFVIGGLVMGVISAFLTPQGPTAILGNVIGACYVGAPVALFLYRKWTWWVYAASGVIFGGLNAAAYSGGFQIALTGRQKALGIAFAIVSCWAGASVCLLLKRSLARTGVGTDAGLASGGAQAGLSAHRRRRGQMTAPTAGAARDAEDGDASPLAHLDRASVRYAGTEAWIPGA